MHENLGTKDTKKITCIDRFLDSISNSCSRSKKFEPCSNSLRSFSHATCKLSKFVSHLAFFTCARTSRSDVRTRKGYQGREATKRSQNKMADSGAKRASLEFFQYLMNSPERWGNFTASAQLLRASVNWGLFLLHDSCVDDKVCVVGIFGKDNVGYKSKAVHLNGTIGKEVFKVCFKFNCVLGWIGTCNNCLNLLVVLL